MSSVKLSRPQKRRRRADRTAVRNAIINTSCLKMDLAGNHFEGTRHVELEKLMHPTVTCDVQIHLEMMSSKLDQIMHFLATGFGYGFPQARDEHSQYQCCEGQVSSVLEYLNPAAPDFIPSAKTGGVDDRTTHIVGSETIDGRIDTLEDQVKDLQTEGGTNKDEMQASFQALEEHVDLEIVRLRAQTDHDYSACRRSLAALEAKFLEFSGDRSVSSQARQFVSDVKIDLNMDLSHFNPMQKGLFRQFGNMLNQLAPEKRRSHMQELWQNVSKQQEGPSKQQQVDVVNLLEQTFQQSAKR